MSIPIYTWILSAVLGMMTSSRNFYYAGRDFRKIVVTKPPTSLKLTAFMHVRFHAMYFIVHFLFFLVGIESLLNILPKPVDSTADVALLIGATYLLVLMSHLAHLDRIRITKAVREESALKEG